MSRGFSLVELVVTITIMVILAFIALPLFNQSEVDATWFHEQVKAAVRHAQRQAVAQRRNVFVVVDASTVKLCYDAGCAPGSRVQDIAGGDYTLNKPSNVTLSPATFSFNGLGQPSPLGGISFSVGNKALVVTAETGHVQ